MKIFSNLCALDHNTNYIFISPHLDDAILSAGNLIYDVKNKKKVTIITVFTEASNKNNKATQEFTQLCGHLDSKKLFLSRRTEDKRLCQFIKVNYIHLGFTDALWRTSFDSIKDVFFKKINNTREDQDLEKAIIKKLKIIIKSYKNALIFAPLSIGNHIDHRIINKICRENFVDVIYWEDYPYNLKSSSSEQSVKKNSLSYFEFNKNIFAKEKLIWFYKSQISGLFSDKPIILKKERYYFIL